MPLPCCRVAPVTAGFSPDFVGFSAVQWILLIGFLIPVAILWGYALISLFRRPDLALGARLLWFLAILVLPVLGALVYFMLRPAPQEQNRRAQARHH
jgi:hypothetical protein